MTPYIVPQMFADLFDDVVNGRRRVFGGIRFRSRFDTGAAARGVALFGDEGLLATPSSTVRGVDDVLIRELSALGVVVADPPALAQLDIASDP